MMSALHPGGRLVHISVVPAGRAAASVQGFERTGADSPSSSSSISISISSSSATPASVRLFLPARTAPSSWPPLAASSSFGLLSPADAVASPPRPCSSASRSRSSCSYSPAALLTVILAALMAAASREAVGSVSARVACDAVLA